MNQRLNRIDILRALAMLWMTLYHFCFDLNLNSLIAQDFYRDPFWTWQRAAIVSVFLFTAGLSQAVAVHQGQTWPRFWKRWAQVAGAAALVTAGSMVMFPNSFIYFGVLHGIAVMPGFYQPAADHRRLRAAAALAGRDVVGHGGRALGAGAPACVAGLCGCPTVWFQAMSCGAGPLELELLPAAPAGDAGFDRVLGVVAQLKIV